MEINDRFADTKTAFLCLLFSSFHYKRINIVPIPPDQLSVIWGKCKLVSDWEQKAGGKIRKE